MNKTEKFINKAIKIHGNNYDYSKVNYIDAKTKVCIICPEHGEFLQSPSRHLEGRECIRCAAKKKGVKFTKTKEKFIEESKEIHKNEDGTPIYDYSKIKYINDSIKVCIIDHRINPRTGCEFGEFWQTPNKHLSGRGNELYSYIIKRGIEKRDTIIDIINESKNSYKFDYSNAKIKYINSNKYITFVSHEINQKTGEEYGEITQLVDHHKKGYTPMEMINSIPRKRKTTEEFIEDSKKIHGNRYIYDKTNYVKDNVKVCIICKEHGEFWQLPNKHLQSHGCAKCRTSKLQTKTRVCLENNNIDYIEECNKKVLPFIKKLKLDFYLPNYNIAIECQGGQHFKKKDYFGGNDGFAKSLKRDIEKNKICKENNINIIYLVNRNEFNDDIINNELFKQIYNTSNIFYDENDLISYIKNLDDKLN